MDIFIRSDDDDDARGTCVNRVEYASNPVNAADSSCRRHGRKREITHPRATLVAEHRRQGDAERETARTWPLVDVLAPERERLSAHHRRHRPATGMLLHLEQSLDLGGTVGFPFAFRFFEFQFRFIFFCNFFLGVCVGV